MNKIPHEVSYDVGESAGRSPARLRALSPGAGMSSRAMLALTTPKAKTSGQHLASRGMTSPSKSKQQNIINKIDVESL